MAAGDVATGYTFGEQGTILTGTVFLDADRDGVRDTGEAGIAGVQVRLTGTDDLGAAVNVQVVTAADGSYQFTDLRPGNYVLTETQPRGYLDGRDAVGTQGGTAANDRLTVRLRSGVNGTNNNFGELRPARLSGVVHRDANGNGRRDAGDPGMASVRVVLTGTDDRGVRVLLVTTTSANGTYRFANLRPGVYAISVTPPADYRRGGTTAGTLGGTPRVGRLGNVVVRAGAIGVLNNFGLLDAVSGKTGFIGR